MASAQLKFRDNIIHAIMGSILGLLCWLECVVGRGFMTREDGKPWSVEKDESFKDMFDEKEQLTHRKASE